MNPILLDLPMPITTPRMILRPPALGDGELVNAAIIESFDRLHSYMPWANVKPTPEGTEIFVRQAAANWIIKENREPYLPLFMFDRVTNLFIGSTGYHHFNWEVPSLEIGYWIRTICAGQGLMTEAVSAVTQYAFDHFYIQRVTITCDINNERSKKLAERLGYIHEGTMKANRRTIDGNISDTLIFARYDTKNLPTIF